MLLSGLKKTAEALRKEAGRKYNNLISDLNKKKCIFQTQIWFGELKNSVVWGKYLALDLF